MSSLIETILLVFGLVAAGYLAGLAGVLRADLGEVAAGFAVTFALPLLLFRTMLTADFEGTAPWALWISYFTGVIVTWTAGHLVTTRVLRRDAKVGVVGGVTAAFSNLVLLGIPFMLGIYGQEGFEILSVLIAVHLPIMIAASVLMFEWVGRADGETMSLVQLGKTVLWRMFTNPLIIGILLGLALRLTGVRLPEIPNRMIDIVADFAGPVALFAMGLSLCKYGIASNVPAGAALSVLKLLLMPAVVLGMAWLLRLPPMTAKVAIAASSLPAGVNSYLIALRFGTGQGLASNAMTIGTAAAVLTTVLWLVIAETVFG